MFHIEEDVISQKEAERRFFPRRIEAHGGGSAAASQTKKKRTGDA